MIGDIIAFGLALTHEFDLWSSQLCRHKGLHGALFMALETLSFRFFVRVIVWTLWWCKRCPATGCGVGADILRGNQESRVGILWLPDNRAHPPTAGAFSLAPTCMFVKPDSWEEADRQTQNVTAASDRLPYR